MPNFEDPNNKMEEAYESVRTLDCHRSRLEDVNIVVLAAYAKRDKDDEPRGEALARRGRPILGKIRITTTEDRAAQHGDVRIILNGDRWGQLSAPMQRAVIDDCLTQIEVLQEDGKTKVDDLGRPKLRKRKFDFEHCGFHEVAARHGKHSVEVHNFKVLFDKHGQTYLPHFEPDDRPTDVLAVAPKRTRTRAKAVSSGSDATHQRGPLATDPLRDRIAHLDQPATILGVAKLELAKKPRKGVIAAIKERVLKLTLLPEYIRVEKGTEADEPRVQLDLDAAVLVTSPAELDTDTLDRLVPGCCDTVVLGWVVDDERRRKEPRQEVIDVVEARIQDIAS